MTEKVTKLERDVWVQAFAWAAASGNEEPAYWAAVAVMQLRFPDHPPGEKLRPSAAIATALWLAVETFEANEVARCPMCGGREGRHSYGGCPVFQGGGR